MLLATDLVDYLVRRGVPFRQAHELVGKAVALSVQTGVPLNELTTEQYSSISPEFGDDVASVFDLDRAFSLRTNPGSPNTARTAARLAYWKQELGRTH